MYEGVLTRRGRLTPAVQPPPQKGLLEPALGRQGAPGAGLGRGRGFRLVAARRPFSWGGRGPRRGAAHQPPSTCVAACPSSPLPAVGRNELADWLAAVLSWRRRGFSARAALRAPLRTTR